MGLVEGFLVFLLAFAGGALVGAKGQQQAAPSFSRPALPSEALECKAVCGRDRVKYFDRTTGDCECISTRN